MYIMEVSHHIEKQSICSFQENECSWRKSYQGIKSVSKKTNTPFHLFYKLPAPYTTNIHSQKLKLKKYIVSGYKFRM